MLDELATRISLYRNGFFKELSDEDKKIVTEKNLLLSELQKFFIDLNDWSHDGIKNSLNNFAATKELKIKDFGPLLRIVLTFSSASPGGIFDVIEILEKDEVLARIKKLLA